MPSVVFAVVRDDLFQNGSKKYAEVGSADMRSPVREDPVLPLANTRTFNWLVLDLDLDVVTFLAILFNLSLSAPLGALVVEMF